MKSAAAIALSAAILLAQTARPAVQTVSAVRVRAVGESSRVTVDVSGEFDFKYDYLHNPERVYFDIFRASPLIDGKRAWKTEVVDKLVQRIRVAETNPGVTRIVVELSAVTQVSPVREASPSRLVIDIRRATPLQVPTEAPAPPVQFPQKPLMPTPAEIARVEAPPPLPPARPEPSAPATLKAEPPSPTAIASGARRTSTGDSSLTRALGLKIGRIVIDAGHGGHDEGTRGAKGLLEKELVLDVALKLGAMVEQRMNTQVVYTRTDDTFVSLEGRTEIANERRADLFLSIHANSSSFPRISGVETFYLNFTDSRDALDVAARENASSQKSIFELQDIIQKITLHEKLDESRELAGRLQTSLFALSSRSTPGVTNRGVKKAPFVVLIGANMPSVLAEIGFVSNAREEALLKKPDHRLKIAESLYRGIARYAESLSHFAMAQE